MYELLKKFIRHNIVIADVPLDEIITNFKPITVKKNTILLSKGETCNKVYFIKKGCLRTYYITAKGEERTRFIATEGQLAGSLSSFISAQPSLEFVGAVEDSELLYISRSRFYTLMQDFPEWENFYLKLLELAYIYQNKRIGELVTLSAGERYALLMKENPQYFQRISNKMLASYLDISQETLSRLKSK